MASRPKLENLNFLYPIIIILVIVLATSAFVIVDSGHVGVIRTLGAVQPQPLPEGFHLKKPFLDKVEQVDIRLTKANSKSAAASKDLQTVETQVTVQYSILGPVAPQTYQRIGQRAVVAATVIEPAIQESVKAVAAQFTAEQLVTKRAEVKQQIQKAIENFIHVTLLDKKVPTALRIANVAITDFEFSVEFNKAIELKVRAEQEALQAINEKTRRVTQAEAGYQERKLAADGQAYEIEASSKAKADAIAREAKALKDNPQLIELRLAEKWDGTLPRLTGGSGVPLINVDSVLQDKK
ncbi:MAG: prohibitin family protein [Thermodesulfobacteriales bacterium]|nr:MAG: prohibitin family protein [Thermodesulfobacteriales bacterium]